MTGAPCATADWRDELLARVRALRAELGAVTAYYDAEAVLWSLANDAHARERAA